jgi:hypothetical protein
LLGAILINKEALGVVERLIEQEQFYEPIHQQIYGATATLICAGRVARAHLKIIWLPISILLECLSARFRASDPSRRLGAVYFTDGYLFSCDGRGNEHE